MLTFDTKQHTGSAKVSVLDDYIPLLCCHLFSAIS